MARKKKTEFTYSKYQKDIFDFVKNGQGNAVVEASAGAGKSTTLIKCLDFIDEDKTILMSAFNTDIVSVLKRKTKDFPNVNCATLHSIGRTMLQRNYPKDELTLDELKYKSYLNTNIKSLSSIDTYSLSKKDFGRYMKNIETFVNFGRAYLCQTIKDLDLIEDRYGIDTVADEKEVALDVMEYGKTDLSKIDFTDMIWLPNVLFCKPIGMKYDWIMLDEVQDLSVCQREIILKCRKINTRMILVGDKKQCIFSFSSADPQSFEKLKDIPNTITLPLSISYRCAENIVNFAKKLVPSIEPNDDGRHGEIKYNTQIDDIQDGDMVLCRNNAPLMQVYVDLIKQGKKCFIRGKDIGLNMKNAVKTTGMDALNVKLDKDGVFVRLYDELFDAINDIMGKYNVTYADAVETSFVARKLDIIKALETLSNNINTSKELIDKISDIFSDKKKGGISLSTIHKAKGLEANNVYIVCNSLMPSEMAKKDWEIEQEYNLMYVAYTRAKNILGFVDETNFETFKRNTNESVNHLKSIEFQINKILKKERKKIDLSNPYVARDIIKHATKIEKINNNDKTKILTNDTFISLPMSFEELLKNRQNKKRLIK